MTLRAALVRQFKKPSGLLGHVVGWILAGRGSNLARNRWTVDLIAPAPGERILEVGCGPGVALQRVLAHGGVTATGVDHSEVMIAQARRRNAKAVKTGRLKLILGTTADVPGAGSFDKAFSINVVQFVDQAAFARQLSALLKPGGLLATTFQPRAAGASREDALDVAGRISRVLGEAGFVNIRTEELDLKPVLAVCVVAQTRSVAGR